MRYINLLLLLLCFTISIGCGGNDKNPKIENKKAIDKGDIKLNGKEITLEVAKQFMRKPNLGFFKGYTVLKDPSAASLLARHGEINGGKTAIIQDGTLFLDDLPKLSDEIVLILSKQKGGLVLSGLKEISDKQAEILSRHQGSLNLYGLKNISDYQKKTLQKHQDTLIIKY